MVQVWTISFWVIYNVLGDASDLCGTLNEGGATVSMVR